MQTIQEFCYLSFSTSKDTNRLIRVPEPRPNLSMTTVSGAANGMINAQIFDENAGNLVALNRAELVRVYREVLI